MSAADPQYPSLPTTHGDSLTAVVNSVLAGMEASREHGFQVYGAPTSDSIAAIKDISFATAKALAPSADDKALAAIIDRISSSMVSGFSHPGNPPQAVVNAAIKDAFPGVPTTI